ncbi:hypothetical protein BFP72_17325 [Reichenbachiella sp. 5M10]|uniref:hypothetical protein n=1 Tax=Reichenbachiella sp. 5M10 TaxID=1889772 RepID=UPI000C1490EC|nr:hypothetical protein [Reichenbachiella sp. 5M10]PIB37039.1 hypothetical protein BFP72_17325 [Reichenbachiella sp. 5M10]
MINLSTETDLIRFIYGETSADEDQQIQQAILCNPELEEALSLLQIDTRILDRLLLNPSDQSANSILQYSLNYSPD